MKSPIKQPLLHFLLLGGLLFVLHTWLTGTGEVDPDRIVVDDAALLEFLQYRSRAFDAASAEQRLAAMDDEERQRLVERYVREEALYREARRLGLHREDYVIKQRLVQKMEYLSRGFGEAGEDLDRRAVTAYFDDNRERYREPPSATFAHVFFDADRHKNPAAAARTLRQRLNGEGVRFSRAMSHGDRFPYHTNYVERSDEFIASHFGESFAQGVLAMEPDEGQWQGPVESEHGQHLVMLVERADGGVPPLEVIYERVAQDAHQARLRRRTEEAIGAIVDGYRVDKVSGGGSS